MAFVVEAVLCSCWAMGEWNMVVGNIIEEMDLVFWKEKRCCNGVDWSITPSLVKEAPITIEAMEVIHVGI